MNISEYLQSRNGGKMGIVEMAIIGLVFTALGGCLVYSLVSSRK